MTANVYLSAYLAPLSPWLSRPDVTDVLINRPGEVWVETTGGAMCREPADQLNEQALQRLARQIAAVGDQGAALAFNGKADFVPQNVPPEEVEMEPGAGKYVDRSEGH